MGSLSIWHWLIVLAIVVVVFGTKKLRNAGSDLGSAVKNFKQAMKEGEADAPKTPDQLSVALVPAWVSGVATGATPVVVGAPAGTPLPCVWFHVVRPW